jgi:hypothetical protein
MTVGKRDDVALSRPHTCELVIDVRDHLGLLVDHLALSYLSLTLLNTGLNEVYCAVKRWQRQLL